MSTYANQAGSLIRLVALKSKGKPTKRAPDGWDSRHFQVFSSLQVFTASKQNPR